MQDLSRAVALVREAVCRCSVEPARSN
jgi:hypothetical protein